MRDESEQRSTGEVNREETISGGEGCVVQFDLVNADCEGRGESVVEIPCVGARCEWCDDRSKRM
jgi:hypothetical protein